MKLVLRTFRNKEREYLKGKINELETNRISETCIEVQMNLRSITDLELSKW